MKLAPKILPFACWPEADRAAWEGAIANDGLFEKGPAAHWRPASRELALGGYARWLGYLMQHEPDALALGIEARATRERVERYVKSIREEIRPRTLHSYVEKLFAALRVMVPTTGWSWLRTIATRLGHDVRPSEKASAWLSNQDLVDLGLRLMDEASGRTAHLDYRDGLIIAVLAHEALRRRNIAGIRLEKNLIPTGETFLLHFEGEEMKNHRAHTLEVPVYLAARIAHFLSHVRPRFLRAETHDFLWPSRNGRPLSSAGIYEVVAKRTKAAFGRAVHIHLCRTLAATLVAEERPGEMHIAVGLLAHSSARTTQGSYVRARKLSASRLHNQNLAQLRAEAMRRRRRR